MSNTAVLNDLVALYDRPTEPMFRVKAKKSFKVPKEYVTDRFKNVAVEISNRFGEDDSETVTIDSVPLPDLADILTLGREENFSLFIPKHRNLSAKLINIFLQAENPKHLLSIACYAHDRVNPYLFIYALSVALIHRKDTKSLKIPNQIQTFPDKYFDSQVFSQGKEEMTVVPQGLRRPIEIPRDYTASDLEEEHRVAYWREDLGINLHHWHWHLVYPTDGGEIVTKKDRRGELFYYSHQQIVARYNFERFCNALKRVERLTDWQGPIKEAYFPKLDSLVAKRAYPARVQDMTMQDLDIPGQNIKVDVDDMIRWRDRIYRAIADGFITATNGSKMNLDDVTGIDILGNIMESSELSPNRQLYGNLHGFGHLMLSYIHDPRSHHLEPFGVIGDFTTAMRDPIFYRWHAFVDDVFQQFNGSLPRYTAEQLDYAGVQITDVNIKTPNAPDNEFRTFWQQSDVDMSRGVDFQDPGSVFVRFTHLNHEPFSYNITVNNTGNGVQEGTCRIFLAPATDERGNPWLFNNQRVMFVEMDRFKVTLRQGQNTITRNSTQSSVTIPFERTFRDLDTNRPAEGSEELDIFNFCGCGWPHHLLVPKGTPDGFKAQLFVMISNYADDKVEQDLSGSCNDAESYCGVRGGKYPDKRPMGYPFNRVARQGADTLQRFLTGNMIVQNCRIVHSDRTVRPRS
uniref:Phenoloxidase 2 n=1 Tax=Holotrichia diomphalia TaxID=33394 RepID=PPO2_HOLDI|nr:RecName: Full=Phenoloxidase 2; AltName: Full=Prophenoloxidase-II; Flags: Precursor [Holotrichia diomphalia]BAC15602.1 prophenoloxidase-I [Holotrichia diomphalia]